MFVQSTVILIIEYGWKISRQNCIYINEIEIKYFNLKENEIS